LPWIVGIDEAGYGPNLGPLVMTAVACRVPEELAATDLWKVLRRAVRRAGSKDDGRLLVADSKLVYSPTRGLRCLENGVLATLPLASRESLTVEQVVRSVCQPPYDGLEAEFWYSPQSPLPVVADTAAPAYAAERFHRACERRGIGWAVVRSVVVCAPGFNALLDRWGTKGAVLGEGLARLLQANCTLGEPGEPVAVTIDKHGGRNHYAALLQNALPEGLVVTRQEGRARSVYQVVGLDRDLRLTIEPRADIGHFCVALASMVSKYLREVFMRDFNRFWQAHIPDLRPTAGYPGDAERFFQAIRPTLERLGIAETMVWRRQ
jgi:ribonuclease HII